MLRERVAGACCRSKLPRVYRPLKGLLEFATEKSHFIFDGDYDQIDGVAMGSSLGPVLVNIFMSHFEEKWVFNYIGRPIWFRFVDDTFTLFTLKSAGCTCECLDVICISFIAVSNLCCVSVSLSGFSEL